MPAGMRFPSRTTDVWLPLGPFVPTFPPTAARIRPVRDRKAEGRRQRRAGGVGHGRDRQTTRDAIPAVEHRPYGLGAALLRTDRAATSGRRCSRCRARSRSCCSSAARNLANLLLARATDASARSRFAKRSAPAVGGFVQQMLTESLLMAITGGALGVLLAWWSVRVFVASRPITVPRIDQVAVDVRVLAFAAARVDRRPASRSASRRRHARLVGRSADVAEGRQRADPPARDAGCDRLWWSHEVALALVLLIGAGLTIRSFAALSAIDLGFQPAHVVTMRVSLPTARYPELERWSTFHRELLRRASAIPAVEAVGPQQRRAARGSGAESEVRYEGQPPPRSMSEEATTCCSRRHLPAIFVPPGSPSSRGRAFTERDTAGVAPVVGGRGGACPRSSFPMPIRSASGSLSSSPAMDRARSRSGARSSASSAMCGITGWSREPANLEVRAARSAADLVPQSPSDHDAVCADCAVPRGHWPRRSGRRSRASIATCRCSASSRWKSMSIRPPNSRG